jgi:hypothetical protein
MSGVKHRTFISAPFDLRILTPWPDIDEELRQEAEAFINQMGLDRIVTITERTTNENRFVIVVWYRAE